MIDCSDSTLNPDAMEFQPTGLSEQIEALKLLGDIVRRTFDDIGDKSEDNFDQIINCSSFAHIEHFPIYIGQLFVNTSVCKCGNASVGFQLIKRIQKKLNEENNSLLEYAIFDTIHHLTVSQVSGDHILEMAKKKSSNFAVSDDVALSVDNSVFLVELLHLIMLCITKFYTQEPGKIKVAPSLPSIDLCIIIDKIFKVQLEINEDKNCIIDETVNSICPRINGWNCLLDVVLNRMSQALPYFNILIQNSGETVSPHTWHSTPAMSIRMPSDDLDQVGASCVYSPSLLARLVDKILIRVKIMLVKVHLQSPWLRSTALQLLLSASAPTCTLNPVHLDFSANQGHNCPTDLTAGWSASSSDSEDDVSIGGITSAENSDVKKAFRSFLKDSGQVIKNKY